MPRGERLRHRATTDSADFPTSAGAFDSRPSSGVADAFVDEAGTRSAGGHSRSIDIKPGSNTNPINLRSKGVIPVAILSTATASTRPPSIRPVSASATPRTRASATARRRTGKGTWRT